MPESKTMTMVRVFLASPSDVPDERARVGRIIDAMNKAEAGSRGITLELLKWEDVAPGMGRPEQVLLDQLAPGKWDIFIGVLWLRFGSGTGGIDPDTQKPYLSGTEEEFKIAYRFNQARGDGFPKIMMYRCRRDPPNGLDYFDDSKNQEQFDLVKAFWKEFSPAGNYPGLYQKYTTPDELSDLVREHLNKRIVEFVDAQRAAPQPPAPATPLAPREPTDAERDAARDRYLKNLQRICNALPLAALSDDDQVHRRADITLDRVYIALDTTTRVPLSDAEKQSRQERAALGRDEDRALPVLQAANQNSRLVIVGDPGSGKSSFVNNLSVLLAGARLNPTSLPALWPHGALLPVRVLLRELAPTLPDEKDLARLSADQRERALCDAVRDHIAKIVDKTFEAGLAAPLILDAIAVGQCLIIFDGLDEVSPERRRLTRETVETFAAHYRDNRFLVTCRVRSYQNDARLASFTDVTLAPFDAEKIKHFVRAWYIAQADLGLMPRERADARAEDLQTAVARLNELAQTPLLLTTMAVVHTAQVELPRERAVLYQRCVELLLRRWHKHKQGESDLLVKLGLSEAGLLEALWAVAFEAHARGKPGQAADLPKSDVLKILAKKMGSYANAEHFLNHVDERAGLLVGRGGAEETEPVYTFPHRTFQEFLAGCFLALGERDFGRQLCKRLREGDKWALSAQLGAEHLLYSPGGDKYKVLDALYVLCPVAEPQDDNDRRGAVWAGNIAVEMGADAIRADTDTRDGGDAFLKRLVQRLVKLIEQGSLSPLERADAGNALAKLGDPRPGVALTLPPRAGEGQGMGAGLPDILWCEIPAGAFTMGTREQDIPGLMKKYGGGESWYKSETPQHEEKSITRAYLIGKYPVTNAQYNAFVQAGGYANAQYWQEAIAHKYWKDGKFKGRWDDDWRIGAYNFGAPFNLDNHPVVGVSWYEAVAFCRWLTEKFRIADFRFQIENNRDEKMKSEIKNLKFEIRLPTEAEWEKAARGPSTPLRSAQDSTHAQDARIFPWNGQLTPQHANYSETKIGATSAVGIFPAGASPYGLLDASGNVWEWCSTKWIENYKGYDKKIKEREGLEGDDLRVLRGGAFYNESYFVRAASRYWYDSDYGFHYFGFRVVASLL